MALERPLLRNAARITISPSICGIQNVFDRLHMRPSSLTSGFEFQTPDLDLNITVEVISIIMHHYGI